MGSDKGELSSAACSHAHEKVSRGSRRATLQSLHFQQLTR